jgi:TadE-like protein
MTEFIIVFPVLFILIFAAFQFTLLYHAKITLNYATFLAARSGAVSNGHIGIMENALARGMAPLYTHCDDPAEVIRAREQVRKEIESGFAWIEIINPDVDTAFGSAVAPLSSSSTLSSTDGSKPLKISIDGTIENAIPNVLKIRTHYCYPLYVPFIDTLLVNIMTLPPNTDKSSPDYCPECQGLFPEGSGTFEDGCLKNGRFPINSQAIVRMQSPAIKSAMTPTTANSSYPGPATDNTNIPLALTLTTVCPAATP